VFAAPSPRQCLAALISEVPPKTRREQMSEEHRRWVTSGRIRLLAGGVAYSRVHTGVHYPGDVVIGAIVGGGLAAMIGAACDRAFQAGKGDGLRLG
jgi:membrane-associated phospholipid phosphatase